MPRVLLNKFSSQEGKEVFDTSKMGDHVTGQFLVKKLLN